MAAEELVPGRPFDAARAVRDAGLAALVAFGLFGLIIGLKTDQTLNNQIVLKPRPEMLFAMCAAVFIGSYGPASGIYHSTPGTLEAWLTERYCLYTTDGRGRLYRGEIHHALWPLQRAEAEIETNTMAAAAGIALPATAPLLHFARRLDVLAWALQRVAG